jgi:tripartite-type tricarboxylate transporter receptor subunit TctC
MRVPLGQPIIIENVGGADGNIGVGRAARARPDGYTICLSIMDPFVLNGAYYSLPYDVLNDFAPISPLATLPTVLAAKRTMPANDLRELIAWLKAHANQAAVGMIRSVSGSWLRSFKSRHGRSLPSFPIGRPELKCRI